MSISYVGITKQTWGEVKKDFWELKHENMEWKHENRCFDFSSQCRSSNGSVVTAEPMEREEQGEAKRENMAACGGRSKAQEESVPRRSSEGQSSAYTELPCLPQWARFYQLSYYNQV